MQTEAMVDLFREYVHKVHSYIFPYERSARQNKFDAQAVLTIERYWVETTFVRAGNFVLGPQRWRSPKSFRGVPFRNSSSPRVCDSNLTKTA